MDTNQLNNLRPCPFCGCEKPLTMDGHIECRDCGGMMVYYSNLPVSEEWNTRIDDKRLSELRASYDEYGDRLASVVESNDALRAECYALKETLLKIENEAEFQSRDLNDEYAALKMDKLAELAHAALHPEEKETK